jgi:hypothetical protein
MQLPFWHVVELAHTVPQVPQLLTSDARFVQVPEQLVYGAAQPQALLSHVRFPPHVAPQKPQLPLLLWRSTHAPPAPPPMPGSPPPPPAPAHSLVGARH